ncbi:MAG: hypothetical protein ACFB20_00125 [Opitutales bacterium]
MAQLQRGLCAALVWLLTAVAASGAIQARLDGGFFGHPQGGVSVHGKELLPSNITDMLTLPDGRVVVCGTTNTRGTLPKANVVHWLFDQAVGTNMAFVARFSADLQEAQWLSVFPYDCIVPRRIARSPDGTIVVGGRRMERLLEWVPDHQQARWQNNQAVLIKLSADGSEVRWVHPGAPDQIDVTGLAVSPAGAVIWSGGTMGRRQAALICQIDPEGQHLLPWKGRPDADLPWAINLHGSAPDLSGPSQFWHFYDRAQEQPYDYDGKRGASKAVRIEAEGLRQGGPLLQLPDGDLIVGATFQYNFNEPGGRRHGGLDLFLARFAADGRLKWSTNLYRRGDGLHRVEQRLVDLAYDVATGSVFVLAHQHGTGRYRLKGDLIGNVGNQALSWVGKVDARTGGLLNGWYFQNPRPDSPDGWPQLSNNALSAIAVDDAGQVYLTGSGGAAVVTTKGAVQSWPEPQKGGEHGVLLVLDNELRRLRFATLLRGLEEADLRRWPALTFDALALNHVGVLLGGSTQSALLPLQHMAAWSAQENERDRGAFLGLLRFEAAQASETPAASSTQPNADTELPPSPPAPVAQGTPPGFRPY